LGAVQAALVSEHSELKENPIRRIVNLLQKMQTEISAEQERDDDLNEKFVCYCKTNDGALSSGTAELRARIPEIEADITEAESLKAQLDQELKDHKAARKAAKESIDSATKQREKQAAAFAAESSELKANIGACKQAITALRKGMGGAFLQTGQAQKLRNVVISRNMDRYSRGVLTDFLATNSQYAPVSGEVTGILSQLQEDMEKELDEATKTEDAAITEFEALVSAKEKEIQAATDAIEAKTQRAGETAVQIVSLKNDLEDTKDSLGADEQFLMELKKSCATKGDEYEARKASRSEELVAISETIKVLNDDDALDLFKKTLPSPSLLQMTTRARDVREDAIAELQKSKGSFKLNFLVLALRGKKQGFEKVIKMIDDMVVTLDKEQSDDEAQKTWCNQEFDSSEDTAKDTKRRIEGLKTRISENEESIAKLVTEITELTDGIHALDKAVEEQTEQRQEEHKDFVQTMAENNAALQLLDVAKNRLNKFYNPAVYKPPPKRELTEEERLYVASGGVLDPTPAPGGIAGTGIGNPLAFVQTKMRDAPPPPPETVDAYTKRDSSGPIALIDRLKNDLSKETQEVEHDEEVAQKEYEEFMTDSALKRQADSKSITEKEAQKAELEADLMAAKDQKKTKAAELLATQQYIAQLHGSCDFLLQNFDLRKEARASEKDALQRAKAVLSGADYSFRQVRVAHFLSK